MADVIEARVPAGTHTDERRGANTETSSRGETPVRLVQDGARGDSPVDLVQFKSGSNVSVNVLGRKDEFIVPASDDSESAVLNTPGTDLSARLQRVLPLVALCTPLAGSNLAEVIEGLLRCDALIVAQRARHSASIQVELSAHKWMAQVRAWASSHPQRDRVVDDSRESIYGDRP
jgi:hypothetical protein